jgi:hypothetical protein
MEMIKEFKATYENGVLTTTVYDDGFTDVCTRTDEFPARKPLDLLDALRINLNCTAAVRRAHMETK